MKHRRWNRTTVDRLYFSQSIDFLVTRDLKDDGLATFKAIWVPDDPSMIPASATGWARSVTIGRMADGLWYAHPFCGPRDTGFDNPTAAAERWLQLTNG